MWFRPSELPIIADNHLLPVALTLVALACVKLQAD